MIAVVPPPGIAVAESLNRDIGKVRDLCNLLGMNLNGSKTNTMIVSKPGTMNSQSPILTIDGTVLNGPDDLDRLGVTFDCKMTFEKKHWSISSAVFKDLVFNDNFFLERFL